MEKSFFDNIKENVESRLNDAFDSKSGFSNIDLSKTNSQYYQQFRETERNDVALRNFFEKFCGLSHNVLKFIVDPLPKRFFTDLDEGIDISGLHVNAKQVVSGAVMSGIIFILLATPFWIFAYVADFFRDFGLFLILVGMFLFYVIYSYPKFLSQVTKMQAQQESLLAILYITIYMRVSPVLENAIYFAADHLTGPLARDLKRILWLTDSNKVSTIENAIEIFIPLWLKRNEDFVKSFMTIYTALEQPTHEQQMIILDKALDFILNRTYEKMRHYSHKLKNPVMFLHTFGMLLPLIALIAFPMVSIFMADKVKVSYMFFGYIVIIPSLLYFFMQRILSKRPGAFSAPDVSKNPYLPSPNMMRITFGKKTYTIKVLPFALIIGLIIMIPGLFHIFLYTIPAYQNAQVTGNPPLSEYQPMPMYLSLLIPIGLSVFIILWMWGISFQRLKARNDTEQIEDDLAATLFQFSNEFTENIPLEIAIQKFLKDYDLLNMKKRSIYTFFSRILREIQSTGRLFSDILFNKKNGIIVEYPSPLLNEIMLVISESVKKGSIAMHNVLIKVSKYLENMKNVKELIYDLLTDTVSEIRMQARFLAPFIAAIVGALTTVIIKAMSDIAKTLSAVMGSLTAGIATSSSSNSMDFFTKMINFSKITPPPLFQALVGIYMVEVVVLLSILADGVNHGFDKTTRNTEIWKNLLFAIVVYVAVVVIGIVSLNSLMQGAHQISSSNMF